MQRNVTKADRQPAGITSCLLSFLITPSIRYLGSKQIYFSCRLLYIRLSPLARSVQRDAGCAPAVLDVSSPLRSDQISGTSRESTLLVQACAGARLPDRIANLSSGRHGSSQPVQVTSSDRNVTLGCVTKTQ